MKIIIGISAFYHDSAAALLVNGKLVAAAQEERFTRKKYDDAFPGKAIGYVLKEAGLAIEEVDTVVFYEKPFLKFERLLESFHAFVPYGFQQFLMAIPVWLQKKIFLKKVLREELNKLGKFKGEIQFAEHHLSHAASAFYPSPFENAAILTIDGVGEYDTLSIGKGSNNNIEIIRELHYPHSLGLLYSAFTYYLGFRVNSGEYKLMGLAPYGNSGAEETNRLVNQIEEKLIDIRTDGSFLLNMDYFNYGKGLTMTKDYKWEQLFGFARREPESELKQYHCNLAMAVQQVTEKVILKLVETTRNLTDCNKLVLAGGVALNCVANGKIVQSKLFDDIWIQPAAGDAGGSIGAALAAWHIMYGNKRSPENKDSMQGAYLGPEFSTLQIKTALDKYGLNYKHFTNFNTLSSQTAELLSESKIIGWFQGRMEFGPRALGNRSILGDTRNPDMQKRMNLSIKYREGFRPFAPAVLEEDFMHYFEMGSPSPYMLFVAPIKRELRHLEPKAFKEKELLERLYFKRSDFPAITHIDYSARLQTVSKETNSRFHKLLSNFKNISGVGMLVNTSFNVRSEPIVCSPEDAIRCFLNTEMDELVLGDFMISKKNNKTKIPSDKTDTV